VAVEVGRQIVLVVQNRAVVVAMGIEGEDIDIEGEGIDIEGEDIDREEVVVILVESCCRKAEAGAVEVVVEGCRKAEEGAVAAGRREAQVLHHL